MGMYTGLRFKGFVKEGFRKDFTPIAMDGEWEISKVEKFKEFGNVSRASFIPRGALAYMPDEWEEEYGVATEGFDTTYDIKTGYWTFQCSLKNYEGTIEEFMKLIPYFIENLEHLEYYYEEWEHSCSYKLIDGMVQLANDKFETYRYYSDYDNGWW